MVGGRWRSLVVSASSECIICHLISTILKKKIHFSSEIDFKSEILCHRTTARQTMLRIECELTNIGILYSFSSRHKPMGIRPAPHVVCRSTARYLPWLRHTWHIDGISYQTYMPTYMLKLPARPTIGNIQASLAVICRFSLIYYRVPGRNAAEIEQKHGFGRPISRDSWYRGHLQAVFWAIHWPPAELCWSESCAYCTC